MTAVDGSTLPVPPFELRQRVGATTFPDDPIIERTVRKAPWWHPDPRDSWLHQGRMLAELLLDSVPADVTLRGARVLDFGCGAGRVLRHLVDAVGPEGELHGIDIDEPSIAWLQEHARPHITAALGEERPVLPYPDGHFTLVYAYSVFTHLVEDWAGWLLELRRVLAPDGVLFATVIGRDSARELGIPLVAADVPGMYVTALGNPWDQGGPVTIHDPEWVAEHWTRAFDIASHTLAATPPPWPHDVIVARPRAGAVTEDDLLATGPDGERDGLAHAAQVRMLCEHGRAMTAHFEHHGALVARDAATARGELDARAHVRLEELAAREAQLRRERAAMLGSRSLRYGRLLRALSGIRW